MSALDTLIKQSAPQTGKSNTSSSLPVNTTPTDSLDSFIAQSKPSTPTTVIPQSEPNTEPEKTGFFTGVKSTINKAIPVLKTVAGDVADFAVNPITGLQDAVGHVKQLISKPTVEQPIKVATAPIIDSFTQKSNDLNTRSDQLATQSNALKETQVDPNDKKSVSDYNQNILAYNKNVQAFKKDVTDFHTEVQQHDFNDHLSASLSPTGKPSNIGPSLPGNITDKGGFIKDAKFINPEDINIKVPFTTDKYIPIKSPFKDREVFGNTPKNLVNSAADLLANLPSATLQAIPRALVTVKNEASSFGKESTKELSPIEARLYGDKEYKNVNSDIKDRVQNGDGILSAVIGAVSGKALDVAFGADVLGGTLTRLSKILSTDGLYQKIEAWKTLGSPSTPEEARQNYLTLAQQLHPDKLGGSDVGFKVLNNARQLLGKDYEFVPSVGQKARATVAKYSEWAGRQTDLSPNANILKPNLGKEDISGKKLNLPKLNAGTPDAIDSLIEQSKPAVVSENAPVLPEKPIVEESPITAPSIAPEAKADPVAPAADLSSVAEAFKSDGLTTQELSTAIAEKAGVDPVVADKIASDAELLKKEGGNPDGEWLQRVIDESKPVISKTDSLIEEAKKYKTADEFIITRKGKEKVDSSFKRGSIDTVYHTTSPQSARNTLFSDTINNGLNVATSPELALGQGGQGATLEIDTRRLDGSKIQKPSADFIESTQGKYPEYELRNAPSKLTPDIKSVSFDKPLSQIGERNFFGNQQNWKDTKEVLADGRVKYTNPNYKTTQELIDIYNKAHDVSTADISNIETPKEEKPKENSVRLEANIVPGLSKFVEQDVLPNVKSTAGAFKNIYKETATLFNPVGQAPKAGVDILMKRKGDFEKSIFRVERATKSVKNMWDKQPEKSRLEFMSKLEAGDTSFANSRGYSDIAKMYRERLNNIHTAISQFKDIPFIENFFPHFWEKPDAITDKVIAQMLGKKPLQGTRSFLKERVFETIEEGMKLGYKPVTTNPEELMQLYEANAKKFIMAQYIKEDMLAKGLWQFVKAGEKAPEDFAKINDSIAKVYFPTKLANGNEAVVPSGEYYAQKDVARLINNYLSKDFIMDTALGKGLMNFKNTLNIFQLGFSAFHLTMEILDSIVSKASIGMSQISQGKILEGLKNIATSPTASITFFRSGQKFFAGDPTMTAIEDSIFTGGASFKEKQYYKNGVLDTFKKNIREGNYIGAILRAPIATIEATMRPLFSYYIPRLKVGAFKDLYAEELKRNASRIADGSKTQEEIAREVWANIENRMGELNYDNLFWNKNLKTAMMLTFRATGWNLGTVREIGGGLIQDPLKQISSKAGRADFKKHGFDFTPKMQYTLGLFTLMASFGAIYQYLHTGKKPEGVKDLFYPRNGAKTESGDDARVEFPSYLKDIYQVSHSPIKTVGNKLAPEFSALIDLITNKDFYGDYIRNTNDHLPTQAKQVAVFLASQLEPFSVQQVQKQRQGKTPIEQQIESFLGIISAPREVIQSQYEKQLGELYQEQRGAQGPETPEQKAIAKAKTDARDAIKKGDLSKLKELIKMGIITPRGAATFVRNSQKTSSQRLYQQLNATRKAALPKKS